MEKVYMTFAKYDERMEYLLQVQRENEMGYFPTKEDVLNAAEVVEDKESYLLTLEYLIETNPAPRTVEEERSTEFIKNFISEHLGLFDTTAEINAQKKKDGIAKKREEG